MKRSYLLAYNISNKKREQLTVTSKKVPFLARTPEKTMLVDNSKILTYS